MSGDESSWPSGDSAPALSVVDDAQAFDDGDQRFQVGGVLGQGGWGRVDAVHDRRLRRDVARKVLNPSLSGSAGDRERLMREALICAQLEHPGIVPVYDAGVLEDGSPYYTMRVVRGSTLAEALQGRTLQERLSLLRPLLLACEAVAYAHRVGIVHRDLKPTNILIGELGEAQVVDWGLARPVEEKGSGWSAILDRSDLTAAGALVGTPRYMSPEQARGEPADRRSDVYSLGATLYEVVSGHPPLQGSSKEVLSAVRSGSVRPLSEVTPDAPAGLVAIVERAMRPVPEDRYADAQAMAEDLAHWLDTRWKDALTAGQRVRVAQQRVLFGLALAVVVGAASAWGLHRLRSERNIALAAETQARDAERDANANLAMAWLNQARRAVVVDARAEAEVLAVAALGVGAAEPDARGLLAAFALSDRPRLIDSALAPECHRSKFSTDGRYLACLELDGVSLYQVRPMKQLWHRDGDYLDIGMAGDHLLVQSPQQQLEVYDVDGTLAHGMPNRVGGVSLMVLPERRWIINDAAFWFRSIDTQDGSVQEHRVCDSGDTQVSDVRDDMLATACREHLRVGPLGQPPEFLYGPFDEAWNGVTALRLLQGQVVLAGTRSGHVMMIDADGPRFQVDAEVGAVRGLAVLEGGRALVVAERGARVLWLDSGVMGERLPSGIDDARQLADGTLLTRNGRQLEFWSLPETPRPRRFKARGGIADVALSQDGQLLAAASGDSETVLWWTRDGTEAGRVDWPLGVAKSVVFSPDGQTLYSTAMSREALATLQAPGWGPGPSYAATAYRRLGFTGDMFWGLGFGPTTLQVWHNPPTQRREDIAVFNKFFFDGETSPDGQRTLFLSDLGEIWQLTAKGELSRLEAAAGAVAVAPSNGELYVVSFRDRIEIRSEQTLTLPVDDDLVMDVAVDPTGTWFVGGTRKGHVLVHRLDDGERVGVLRGHQERVASVSFDKTGRVLATGSWDGEARLWDMSVLEMPVEDLASDINLAWGLAPEQAMQVEAF